MDSRCGDFVGQMDSVTFANGCCTWYDVVDGSLVPDFINGWSYFCRSVGSCDESELNRTTSWKEKRQTFPTLSKGSSISGGAGNGQAVTSVMADVEAVNDPEGTGVNVALITEAAQ
jgi:hypothetical protein